MENDEILSYDKPLQTIAIQKNEDYDVIKANKKRQRKRKKIIKYLLIIMLFIVYIVSPFSNVKEIIVTKTKFVSEDEIVELSGITNQSRFILINNIFKPKIKNDFIKDYTIINEYNGIIKLQIQEKKGLGYIIKENEIELLLEDGSIIKSNDLNDYIITLPKINSDDVQFLKLLSQSLSQLQDTMISRISEIEKHQTSYEENTIILKMEDGNKVFGSMKDLHLIQNYNNILESVVEKNQCIQLDETTNSAFKFKCP